MTIRASLLANGSRSMILGGLVALGTMLSACGGGGGGVGHVASTPPPPPQPPGSPPPPTLGTPIVNTSAPLVRCIDTESGLVEAQPVRRLQRSHQLPISMLHRGGALFIRGGCLRHRQGARLRSNRVVRAWLLRESQFPGIAHRSADRRLPVDGIELDYTRFGSGPSISPEDRRITVSGAWLLQPPRRPSRRQASTYTVKTSGFTRSASCGCNAGRPVPRCYAR